MLSARAERSLYHALVGSESPAFDQWESVRRLTRCFSEEIPFWQDSAYVEGLRQALHLP